MSTKNGADNPAGTPGDLENLIAGLRDRGADPEACEAALWREGTANRIWEVVCHIYDKGAAAEHPPSVLAFVQTLASAQAIVMAELVNAHLQASTIEQRSDVHREIASYLSKTYLDMAERRTAPTSPPSGIAARH